MRPNILFDNIRAGQTMLGLCNMYPAPGLIEGTCKGWDFVWIDAQHGQYSYDSVLAGIHAAAAIGVEVLVRVPGHEFGVVGPFADLAPSAIMFPMVNNAEDARTVVQNVRFAPLGRRSYGGRRVIDIDGRNYYKDRELMLVAQIETLEAVDNAEAIANTDGVDALFFGPDDMRVQLGIGINTPVSEDDQLRAAMAKTATIARDAGKSAGTVGASPEALRMCKDMGYQLIACGSDVGFLRVNAAKLLESARTTIGAAATDKPTGKPSGIYGG